MRICFLILHYKSVEDTLKCIDSIKALSCNSKPDIVVMDNGCDEGKAINCDNPDVSVLSLEENLGFSAANNIGYRYAVERFNPDFIIVTNNDIFFEQKNFIELLIEEYNRSNYFILGPDIINENTGGHQSPLSSGPLNKAEIDRFIKRFEFYSKHYILSFIINEMIIERLHDLTDKLGLTVYIRAAKRKFLNADIERFDKEYKNVRLLGACLVLSRNFINLNSNVFTPEIYLYNEENFLTHRCIENGWLIVYCPTLYVKHNDRSSLRKSFKNVLARDKFRTENLLKSTKEYRAYLENKSRL
jgi:GT2 family glycosyltransferase